MHIWALLCFLLCCIWVEITVNSQVRWRRFQEGNFILGALFPITRGHDCGIVREEGLFLVEAFVFKVEACNRGFHSSGGTIGYDIRDTCSNPKVAVREVLDMLSKNNGRSWKNCGSATKGGTNCGVIAIVGPDLSSGALGTSSILSAYGIPQISYGASSSLLDDRSIYSSFFRTCPSDKQLGSSLASLVAHFGWSCINIISSTDLFYLDVATSLKQDLENRTICVSLKKVIRNGEEILQSVFDIRARESVAVNVILGGHDLVVSLFTEVKKLGLTRQVWIGCQAWDRTLPIVERYADAIDGVFWLVPPEEDLGEFKAHASRIESNISKAYCSWLEKDSHWPAFCKSENVGRDSEGLPIVKVGFVMNAVVAIASGLKIISNCGFQKSQGLNCTIGNFSLFLARELILRSLGNEHFISNRNMDRSLNAILDWNVQYEIINMRFTEKRTLVSLGVGKWTEEQKLIINDGEIRWFGNESRVPFSECRDKCPSGFNTKYDNSTCYWNCEKCPRGTYRNNQSSCAECEKDQMPNDVQNACVNKPLTIINTGDVLTVLLLSACGLGVILTLLVIAVIVRYQDTPVVKGTNFPFTIFTLIVLFVWFLSPLLYIAKPSDESCQVRIVSLAMTYTAISSLLLTKTNRLIKIFSAKTITKNPFLGNWWHGFLTCNLMFVQLMLNVAYICFSPPKIAYNYNVMDSLVVTCGGNWRFDIASLGYNTMLSIVCLCLAYQAKNLPKTYNECRWICIAILTNFSSWSIILIIRYSSLIEEIPSLICTIVVLIVSAYSTLSLLLCPKVWLIFLRPIKNTMRATIESTRRYSLEQAGVTNSSNLAALKECPSNLLAGTESPRLHDLNHDAVFITCYPLHEEIRRHSDACLLSMNRFACSLPIIGPRQSHISSLTTVKE
ncbi:extracellular calcium-sensing receptor-like [Montipora capricornis]|uniref:extracellular calcium-sensing receptor-like n=1 Tax=Montipora capricornis TaxID=246305 RepID=UPI0035F15928